MLVCLKANRLDHANARSVPIHGSETPFNLALGISNFRRFFVLYLILGSGDRTSNSVVLGATSQNGFAIAFAFTSLGEVVHVLYRGTVLTSPTFQHISQERHKQVQAVGQTQAVLTRRSTSTLLRLKTFRERSP